MSNIRGKLRQQYIDNWLEGHEDPDVEVKPTRIDGKYIVRYKNLPEPPKQFIPPANTPSEVQDQKPKAAEVIPNNESSDNIPTTHVKAAYKADPTYGGVTTEPEANFYEELETLHAMVSNYETVSKALILIIELYMSNPLVINKIIVPTEDVFSELIKVLTGADDIEVRYTEEVGCTLGSKKYKLVEDIIVIKSTEPKSLKYSHPDVIRLFDRFNISVKMLAKP
jgi:hypothetical protein